MAATVLLAIVVTLTMGGARASSAVQLGLVALLVVLVGVAVAGALPSARSANWTPFAPHGWGALGRAGSVLLAELLRVAVGSLGPVVAAAAAVALTLAATNAYLSGAVALAAELRPVRDASTGSAARWLQLAVAGTGVVLLGAVAAGAVSTTTLVALPTTLFLTVYLGCTAAAARVLVGRTRVAAVLACLAVAAVLAFCGPSLFAAVAVVGVASMRPRRRRPMVLTPAVAPCGG